MGGLSTSHLALKYLPTAPWLLLNHTNSKKAYWNPFFFLGEKKAVQFLKFMNTKTIKMLMNHKMTYLMVKHRERGTIAIITGDASSVSLCGPAKPDTRQVLFIN